MKFKMTEVTNSSSTSFVVWGIEMDMDELRDKYGEGLAELREDGGSVEDFLEDSDFFWSAETIMSKAGLEASKQFYDDRVMIGVSPFKMKDDETLQQFKERICKMFEQSNMSVEPGELYHIEECWEDR